MPKRRKTRKTGKTTKKTVFSFTCRSEGILRERKHVSSFSSFYSFPVFIYRAYDWKTKNERSFLPLLDNNNALLQQVAKTLSFK
jgi:hypothetical protein